MADKGFRDGVINLDQPGKMLLGVGRSAADPGTRQKNAVGDKFRGSACDGRGKRGEEKTSGDID